MDHITPNQSRFIWFLDEFAEESGATRVVPGSHLWNPETDSSGATSYESVPAEAPAGSLLIYTDMLLHGTGANISTNRERASINFGLTPPWCRPSINFPLVLDPEVIALAISDLGERRRIVRPLAVRRPRAKWILPASPSVVMLPVANPCL